MDESASYDTASLKRREGSRETRWAWGGGLVALAVLIYVYASVYEHSLQQSGPLRCIDGWRSSSIGIQGACSHHGGVDDGPIRTARLLAWLAGIPSALTAWFTIMGLAHLTSPYRKLLRKLPKVDDNNESEDGPKDLDDNACPKCGGKMLKLTKFYKNRLPDRDIWEECTRCRHKKYFMLE